MKNFKMNKKKLLSLLVLGGITLGSIGNAEILSYNTKTTLRDGREAIIYFTKTVGDIDYAYVSSGNMVGFVYQSDVNIENTISNNYFMEDNGKLSIQIDTAYMYQTPDINDTRVVGILKRNDIVDIIAKTNDGWYAVYTGSATGFMHESSFIEVKQEDTITVAKLKKNNVNVRSSATTKKDNIIGFADVSDTFKIIGREDNWYIVDYLGQRGYIREDFIKETVINEEDFDISRMAYLNTDEFFYTNLDSRDGLYLPAYQNVGIIGEEGRYYKVMVDGIIGYIEKTSVKKLSRTCVVVDLSRQILRVYKNGQEVFRTHIISGRESMQTHIGCFKIGHKVKGYQLTKDNYVDYWIQYDDNRGIHDASWQKDKYYSEVASKAYDNYGSGYGKTYPFKHGSHGCNNMKLSDVIDVYNLVSVGDNVLVIGPNELIKKHLISKLDIDYTYLYNEDVIKVKRLV